MGTGDGSYDYYSFRVLQPATATFDIDSTNGLDSYLQLFNANGDLLRANDDSGQDRGSNTHLDSRITYRFQVPGIYYVSVGACCARPVTPNSRYKLHVSLQGAQAQPTVSSGDFLIDAQAGSPVGLELRWLNPNFVADRGTLDFKFEMRMAKSRRRL